MSTNEVLRTEAVSELTGPESLCGTERTSTFDDLVRNHHPELRKHVYRRVGSWADADDILQETYANLWRSRRQSAIRNVRAYLFRAAGNLAYDWLRKRRVRESVAREEALRSPPVAHSAEEVCETRDEFEHLMERIDDLPQQCRLALLLYRHEGLSLDEVGARLGIQPKSVHALIARAMKYLLETVPQDRVTRRGHR